MRISIEDLLTLLEQELYSGTSTKTPAKEPAVAFDYNQDLLYALYRVVYAVITHANEHKIKLSKELA